MEEKTAKKIEKQRKFKVIKMHKIVQKYTNQCSNDVKGFSSLLILKLQLIFFSAVMKNVMHKNCNQIYFSEMEYKTTTKQYNTRMKIADLTSLATEETEIFTEENFYHQKRQKETKTSFSWSSAATSTTTFNFCPVFLAFLLAY